MTRKKILITGLTAFGLLLASVFTFAGQTQGRKEISLNGGASGNVLFPHHQHQEVVTDCQTCHADFDQTEGALDAAKKANVLKKKQIMNNTCLKCHRSMKKTGEKTGPVSCKGCHIK